MARKNDATSQQVSQEYANCLLAYRAARQHGSKAPWGILVSKVSKASKLTAEEISNLKTWAKKYDDNVPVTTERDRSEETTMTEMTTTPETTPVKVGEVKTPAKPVEINLHTPDNGMPDEITLAPTVSHKAEISALVTAQARMMQAAAQQHADTFMLGGFIANKTATKKVKGTEHTVYTFETLEGTTPDPKLAVAMVNRYAMRLMNKGAKGAVFCFNGTAKPTIIAVNLR